MDLYILLPFVAVFRCLLQLVMLEEVVLVADARRLENAIVFFLLFPIICSHKIQVGLAGVLLDWASFPIIHLIHSVGFVVVMLHLIVAKIHKNFSFHSSPFVYIYMKTFFQWCEQMAVQPPDELTDAMKVAIQTAIKQGVSPQQALTTILQQQSIKAAAKPGTEGVRATAKVGVAANTIMSPKPGTPKPK